MNKKLAGIRAVLSICAAIGWWGFLYPELTMTPDTYEIVWEEDAEQRDSDEEIYRRILEADESQIRYKSRLLEQLEALIKKLKFN